MTWADLTGAAIEELGIDGNRRGIEVLRNRAFRDAAIDLQRYIRAFRTGNTTVYNVADLTEVDWAHRGTLPPQAKPKAFYIVSTGDTVLTGTTDNPDCVRNRLDYVPWEHRQSMICDQYGVRRYQYTISPFSREFLVHPLINDETYLLVVWDGLKMDFQPVDEVPFPEWAAEALAAYAKWKILLEVDRRVDIAREWFDKARNTGIYPNLRLALAREQRESQDADGKDEEYDNSMPTIVGFGAQDIPFLAKVTKLSGLDNDFTALSAIPTVNIDVSTRPYAVSFQNDTSGVQEFWQLASSTEATDGVSVQRPNDYASTTNEKVWLKKN